MALTTTALSSFWIEQLAPKMENTLNTEAPVLKLFKKTTKQYHEYEIGHLVTMTTGSTHLGESAALPPVSTGTMIHSKVSPQAYAHSFEVTWKAKAEGKGRPSSFGNRLKDEMKDAVKSIALMKSRSFYLRGDAVLSTVNGATSSATLTLDGHGTKYLRQGEEVSIVDSRTTATKTVIDAGTHNSLGITSIDSATQVTLDDTPDNAIADNYFVISPQTISDGTTTKYEPWGLETIINDSTGCATFQNVTRATYPGRFDATVERGSNNVMRVPSKTLIDTTMRKMQIKNSSNKPTQMLAPPGIIGQWLTGLESKEIFTSQKISQGMGELSLSYGGKKLEIIEDRFAPDNDIILLTKGSIECLELSPGSWVRGDGSLFHRKEGYGSYLATYWGAHNLVCRDPRENARIKYVENAVTDAYNMV